MNDKNTESAKMSHPPISQRNNVVVMLPQTILLKGTFLPKNSDTASSNEKYQNDSLCPFSEIMYL